MSGYLSQLGTIRWQGYNYASVGEYNLTNCTEDRRHWFGHIADGVMMPIAMGDLAQRCWDAIPQHMPHVDVEEFVVVPNHWHQIVIMRERFVGPWGPIVIGPMPAEKQDLYPHEHPWPLATSRAVHPDPVLWSGQCTGR